MLLSTTSTAATATNTTTTDTTRQIVRLNDSTAVVPIPMLRLWLRNARMNDSLRVMLIRELDERMIQCETEKATLAAERINETKREQREKTLWIVIAAVLGFLIITR
jgi:hypothetical protein